MPSEHVATWQTLPLHIWLAQSEPSVHALPLEQAAHVPPPQSTSVSAAFFTWSVQVAAWQMCPAQVPLAQSVPTLQPLPLPHAVHDPPPQSTLVSAPFLIPSLQLGAWQLPPEHTPDAHATPQALQLFGSLLGLTQALLQESSPEPHTKIGLLVQVTTTDVTLLAAMTPLPPDTVQICPVGWASTLTAKLARLATVAAKENGPFAEITMLSAPLFCKVSTPARPLTVPPTT
jgi:hypothetical protein